MSMFDNMMAYSEVYEVLNLMEDEYRKRVPQKVIDFFDDERMKEYKPEIRVDIPLEEQNLRRETVILLVILTINYWCDTEEEKQSFINELERNEQLKKELAEKYNPDNLFKKTAKQDDINEQVVTNEVAIIKYEESLLKKIWNKILSIFKK